MIVVRCKESGNIIERVDSFEDGQMLIKEYESQDKYLKVYEEGFYEVAEVEYKKGKIHERERSNSSN